MITTSRDGQPPRVTDRNDPASRHGELGTPLVVAQRSSVAVRRARVGGVLQASRLRYRYVTERLVPSRARLNGAARCAGLCCSALQHSHWRAPSACVEASQKRPRTTRGRPPAAPGSHLNLNLGGVSGGVAPSSPELCTCCAATRSTQPTSTLPRDIRKNARLQVHSRGSTSRSPTATASP